MQETRRYHIHILYIISMTRYPTPIDVCQPQPNHTRLDLVFTDANTFDGAVVEECQRHAKRSYRSDKFNY